MGSQSTRKALGKASIFRKSWIYLPLLVVYILLGMSTGWFPLLGDVAATVVLKAYGWSNYQTLKSDTYFAHYNPVSSCYQLYIEADGPNPTLDYEINTGEIRDSNIAFSPGSALQKAIDACNVVLPEEVKISVTQYSTVWDFKTTRARIRLFLYNKETVEPPESIKDKMIQCGLIVYPQLREYCDIRELQISYTMEKSNQKRILWYHLTIPLKQGEDPSAESMRAAQLTKV